MSGVTNLPYQLLIDEIIDFLDTKSLLKLRQVSRSFQQLADDNLIWRRKIAKDFTFPLESSARTSGWKNLYKGLYRPELYTWGDYGNNRIGQRLEEASLPSRIWNIVVRARGVPFPLNIKWQEAQQCINCKETSLNTEADTLPENQPGSIFIDGESYGAPIQIHAGGWSFYALTGEGRILAWGSCSLDPLENSVWQDDFETPTLLDLDGKRAKSLTVGRQHAVAQLDDGSIVEWTRGWDRPVRIDISELRPTATLQDSPSTSSSPSPTKIVQIEAGWDFTAILTRTEGSTDKGGVQSMAKTSIVLWRTKWTLLWREVMIRPLMRAQEGDEAARHGDAPHAKWRFPPVEMDVITLPPLSSPVIKIAAGEDFIIALTEKHSVHYFSIPSAQDRIDHDMDRLIQMASTRFRTAEQAAEERSNIPRMINHSISTASQLIRAGNVAWQHIPLFCSDLRASGVKADGSNVWDDDSLNHLITANTKITHISAQFQHFAVYSPDAGSDSQQAEKGKGIVILGNKENVHRATVMPDLQGIQVIKVTHGDWHHGALTLDGRVLAWGEQEHGAVGVWDSLPVPAKAPSTLNIPRSAPHQSTMPVSGIAQFVRHGVVRPRHPQSQPLERVESEERHDGGNQGEEKGMVKAEVERFKFRNRPVNIENPLPVRFGFPTLGEERQGRIMMEEDAMETKYVFDIAFAGWHSGALAIDRSLMTEDDDQYSSMVVQDQNMSY